ncbi:ImmA/IrrE family metallo-endopeptidase [Altererythrobacter sp. Z27]|uniref:ImmA/IrrE family metallo-endopeptidase n=1 Tax=Altererythrobacter sp. Z27 TaxID=3461147 RepID=UPI004044D061
MTEFSHQSRILPEQLAILREYAAVAPVRVGALAKALGLEVVVAALPLKISGMIKPNEDGDGYVIKVNRFEPKARQRFTIAHEIAHFLLHRDRIQAGVVDSVLYRSKLSSRLEAEANRLAADIIMPRDLVEEIADLENLSDHDQLVERLAQRFDVSKQAMDIRMGG